MLHMDQHCPCFLCELFNSSLGYSVLKMRSESAIADCLVIIWLVALKTFLCKNSIVCVKFLHSDAKVFWNVLICCFGLCEFDESLESLQVGVHLRGGMVVKTVATQKRSDAKKPDICGMIPRMLDVNASKDVLFPATVYDFFLMKCVSLSILPSKVSCEHIQKCTTHKLVVDWMQACNRRCILLPSLVFLWLPRSGLFFCESLIVSSDPALYFWSHWLDGFIRILRIIVKKDILFIFWFLVLQWCFLIYLFSFRFWRSVELLSNG